MPAILRHEEAVEIAFITKPWMRVVGFAAAALFVTFLVLACRLDLSPGLF